MTLRRWPCGCWRSGRRSEAIFGRRFKDPNGGRPGHQRLATVRPRALLIRFAGAIRTGRQAFSERNSDPVKSALYVALISFIGAALIAIIRLSAAGTESRNGSRPA